MSLKQETLPCSPSPVQHRVVVAVVAESSYRSPEKNVLFFTNLLNVGGRGMVLDRACLKQVGT